MARMAAQPASRGELTHAQERAAMAAGLGQAQEARAAWTRGDLLHCIGQHLPDHAAGRDQAHAWQLLEDLADRAIAGQAGEEVLRLDAPEWPRVPDSLRRADGESIYRPHGIEQYATRAQLSMEEQLLADAQADGAPHLAHEQAATLLGADLAQLETQLRADAPAPDGVTQGGLRVDQATAAFLALTSPRRAEFTTRPAFPGSDITVRDVEPLAGTRSARDIELGSRHAAREYIRAAREAGHGWDEIGQALGLMPGGDADQEGLTVAEAADAYAAGRPDTEAPWRPRSFIWRCRSCEQAISDHGLIGNPADDEVGHADDCRRLAAAVADWDASWEAEP